MLEAICPTIPIGKYWVERLRLDRHKVKFVTRECDIRGTTITPDNHIIIQGDKYDFPPSIDDKLMRAVRRQTYE